MAGWRAIIRRTNASLTDDHVAVVAAGVAFFGLLAVFPAIAATVSIAGLIADPSDILTQIDAWAAGLPESAAAIVRDQGHKIATGADSSLGWAALLGILFALFGASSGVKKLMEAMNIAYGEKEERSFLRFQGIGLALTGFLVVGLAIAIGLIIGVPLMLERVGIATGGQIILNAGRWLILAIAAIGGLSVLYRYGPSRPPPGWRWITPGSTLAIAIWIVGSIGFSFYVRSFGSYNETYGTLGGAIVLLLWLWLSAYAVLLGAEFDSEIERQASLEVDT